MAFMGKKEEYANGVPETIVGATVKIEGDLVSDGDIKVEGIVTGKIKTSKNLYVGREARIEADVEAGNAICAGTIKGDIKVREGLVVSESGHISGNLTCSRLSVAEGATLNGNCTMPEGGAEVQEQTEEEE